MGGSATHIGHAHIQHIFRAPGPDSLGRRSPVFVYVAMVPWQYFANALTESSNSLVASQNLIKKVYFPRLVIPLGSVLAGLVDFCFAFLVEGENILRPAEPHP
jgi:ABC-type polysaccharide/polyol phosphate export permease